MIIGSVGVVFSSMKMMNRNSILSHLTRKLLKFLESLEFIQNSIGKREVEQNNLLLSHTFKDSEIYYIKHDDSHCCGKYIFINLNEDGGQILRHEYGHRIQSKILGMFFYPLIFIPSWVHFLFWKKFRNNNWDGYYSFYCEKWANILSMKKKASKIFVYSE